MKFSLRTKLLGLLVGASIAAIGAYQTAPKSFSTIVQETMGGVVFIDSGTIQEDGTQTESVGTGFIVDDSGLIVTNAHVVADLASPEKLHIRGKNNSKWWDATIVAGDGMLDFALLRIDAWQEYKEQVGYKALPIARAGDMRQGDKVWAVGMPIALGWTLTSGYLAAPYRKTTPASPVYYLQTDLAITHGNSGGPLLNMRGEVIGINNMIRPVDGGEISYAIPSEFINKAIRNFRIDEKAIRWPMLGIRYKPAEDGLGIEVVAVVPKSAAEGVLNVGDKLIEISTRFTKSFPLIESADLANHTFVLDIGDRINLKVLDKQEKLRIVSVALGAGKTSAEIAQDIASSHTSRRDE